MSVMDDYDDRDTMGRIKCDPNLGGLETQEEDRK
jgi:hypothetical protein